MVFTERRLQDYCRELSPVLSFTTHELSVQWLFSKYGKESLTENIRAYSDSQRAHVGENDPVAALYHEIDDLPSPFASMLENTVFHGLREENDFIIETYSFFGRGFLVRMKDRGLGFNPASVTPGRGFASFEKAERVEVSFDNWGRSGNLYVQIPENLLADNQHNIASRTGEKRELVNVYLRIIACITYRHAG